jgi:hypothetical protein
VSDDFLSRWSRRKHASRAGRDEPDPEPVLPPAVAPADGAVQAPGSREAAPVEPPSLPDVASLTPESDFTPFMQPQVDAGVRREALKTLFSDPRFNVMDGLDVYIDDYSKPDPLPEGWLGKMAAVARLGDWKPPPEEAEGEVASEPELLAGGPPDPAPVRGIDTPDAGTEAPTRDEEP